MAGLALAALPLAWAGADYIGAGKCKMCHKVEYQSWQASRHARAFESLKEAERGKAECLRCHAMAGDAGLPGVQCESCHGPGSDYKSMKIMKDRDAAVAAGLVIPDEATCRSCHEGAPHDQEAFDFATAREKGVHKKKAR
jgi:nitrate/TMAO reductase-like tetraheme cytochrome c subunit